MGHTTFIGTELPVDERKALINLLRENKDVFAWSLKDMPGIDPSIACHRLNIIEEFKPVRQKPRKMAPERKARVAEEIERMIEAGIIRPVRYPKWLANIVAVPKKNGKIRVCIDFTNLNKACPSDPYPLPRIIDLVDATAGYERLSFMDGYSGYNQIPMFKDDQEHTSFITDKGVYCFLVMPFGLKNAGATYQRLVDEMFKDMIGKTVEVYIDDMVVKSQQKLSHLLDLKRTFERLRQYGMKLNPAKCSFGLTSGKFLGYMMTQRGIEANPEQIRAILEMPSPKNKKEVQRLTGRLAALNRFISRSSDKCKHFFQILKKAENFGWSEECENAFNEIKKYLTSPPVLASPKTGQTIYIYLASSDYAVSAVLFVLEPDEKPVYFVSKSLTDAETRYSKIEKMALALMHAARRLKPYFEGRQLVVYTEYPLKKVLGRTDDSSRLATWATYLGAYSIHYEPRTAEKGHALASLMADFPIDDIELSASALDDESLPDAEDMLPMPLPWEHLKVGMKKTKAKNTETVVIKSAAISEGDSGLWEVFTDGSASADGAGVGCVIITPEGLQIEKAIRLGFTASNNQAEYEAAVSGLKTALHLGARKVRLTTDSKLVVNQFSGAYKARNEKMASYLEVIHELAKEFEVFSMEQRPRLENRHADALAYVSGAVKSTTKRYIVVDFQEFPSIYDTSKVVHHLYVNGDVNDMQEVVHDPMDVEESSDNQAEDWRLPYIRYLLTKELPNDQVLEGKIKRNAWKYKLIDGELYKKPVAMEPYLRCVTPEVGQQLLAEAHDGCCGNHSGGRSLAHKLLSQGYFWPYMKNDAKEYAKKCVACQLHGPLINMPANELHPVMSPWPFSKWGLDIVGPFPTAPGGVKYLLAATDYFTKWVEAVALVRTEASQVRRFIWENIVCRFGIPAMIISDNGKQFDSETIKSLCEGLHIKHNFSTPYYAQSNGQAEATNKVILNNLKKTLDKAKGRRVRIYYYRITLLHS